MNVFFVVFVFVAMQGSLALAQDPGVTEERSGGGPEQHKGLDPNCQAEVKQLCPNVEPGGGRIRKCLQDNEGKLSPTCRQQLQEKRAKMKQRMEEVRTACEADVKRFCPNIEPGGGRLRDCLKSHVKELSPTCAQKMEHKKPR
jgi:hypothetical protein